VEYPFSIRPIILVFAQFKVLANGPDISMNSAMNRHGNCHLDQEDSSVPIDDRRINNVAQ
jgi:hypothetical protein